MQMYEIIAHMTATFGLTFDEAVVAMVWFTLALAGGSVFMFDLVFDVGHFLYRGIRCLLRAVLRILRRLLKVHFQK